LSIGQILYLPSGGISEPREQPSIAISATRLPYQVAPRAAGDDTPPLKIRMWSRHSRPIEPITRSAYAFCQGDRRAVMTLVMPSPRSSRTPSHMTRQTSGADGPLEPHDVDPSLLARHQSRRAEPKTLARLGSIKNSSNQPSLIRPAPTN